MPGTLNYHESLWNLPHFFNIRKYLNSDSSLLSSVCYHSNKRTGIVNAQYKPYLRRLTTHPTPLLRLYSFELPWEWLMTMIWLFRSIAPPYSNKTSRHVHRQRTLLLRAQRHQGRVWGNRMRYLGRRKSVWIQVFNIRLHTVLKRFTENSPLSWSIRFVKAMIIIYNDWVILLRSGNFRRKWVEFTKTPVLMRMAIRLHGAVNLNKILFALLAQFQSLGSWHEASPWPWPKRLKVMSNNVGL